MLQITTSKWNWFVELIAAFLVFLFIYTAINKLVDIERFRTVLSSSPYLKQIASPISWLMPITELLICLLLFIPMSRAIGLLCSFILMGIFSLYVGLMILFSTSLPCSCGGVIQKMTWPQHLIFNICISLLSLLGWKIKRNLNKNFIAINRQSRTPVQNSRQL